MRQPAVSDETYLGGLRNPNCSSISANFVCPSTAKTNIAIVAIVFQAGSESFYLAYPPKFFHVEEWYGSLNFKGNTRM